jgi:hypothetical protein
MWTIPYSSGNLTVTLVLSNRLVPDSGTSVRRIDWGISALYRYGLVEGMPVQYVGASAEASFTDRLAYEKYDFFIHVWPLTIQRTRHTHSGNLAGWAYWLVVV